MTALIFKYDLSCNSCILTLHDFQLSIQLIDCHLFYLAIPLCDSRSWSLAWTPLDAYKAAGISGLRWWTRDLSNFTCTAFIQQIKKNMPEFSAFGCFQVVLNNFFPLGICILYIGFYLIFVVVVLLLNSDKNFCLNFNLILYASILAFYFCGLSDVTLTIALYFKILICSIVKITIDRPCLY